MKKSGNNVPSTEAQTNMFQNSHSRHMDNAGQGTAHNSQFKLIDASILTRKQSQPDLQNANHSSPNKPQRKSEI